MILLDFYYYFDVKSLYIFVLYINRHYFFVQYKSITQNLLFIFYSLLYSFLLRWVSMVSQVLFKLIAEFIKCFILENKGYCQPNICSIGFMWNNSFPNT